jgi:hypothetical protein
MVFGVQLGSSKVAVYRWANQKGKGLLARAKAED